jgi:hypothetical protein
VAVDLVSLQCKRCHRSRKKVTLSRSGRSEYRDTESMLAENNRKLFSKNCNNIATIDTLFAMS